MTADEFLKWFGRWKDVITTVVAVGAIVAVVFQILQAGRAERHRIQRDQVAARATLPLTLATLAEYGLAMMEALAPIERWLEQGQQDDPPTFQGPRVPSETIASMEKVLAAYPNDDVARQLAALLGEVQVLQSRCQGLGSDEGIRTWSIAMTDNVLMAASIVARCENLFPFAREGTDVGEPSGPHLQQILNRSKFRGHLFPRVWAALARYPDEAPVEPGRRINVRGIFGNRADQRR